MSAKLWLATPAQVYIELHQRSFYQVSIKRYPLKSFYKRMYHNGFLPRRKLAFLSREIHRQLAYLYHIVVCQHLACCKPRCDENLAMHSAKV